MPSLPSWCMNTQGYLLVLKIPDSGTCWGLLCHEGTFSDVFLKSESNSPCLDFLTLLIRKFPCRCSSGNIGQGWWRDYSFLLILINNGAKIKYMCMYQNMRSIKLIYKVKMNIDFTNYLSSTLTPRKTFLQHPIRSGASHHVEVWAEKIGSKLFQGCHLGDFCLHPPFVEVRAIPGKCISAPTRLTWLDKLSGKAQERTWDSHCPSSCLKAWWLSMSGGIQGTYISLSVTKSATLYYNRVRCPLHSSTVPSHF